MPVPEAVAAKRLALVIGVDQYPEFPKSKQLKNAVNDARAVGKALENIAFSVTYVENVTKSQMSYAVGTLEHQVSPGDVVFLFFAGHGVDFGGTNYLLPKDFPAPVDKQGRRLPERALKDASFNASELLSSIQQRGARVVVAVFDACREPFDEEGKRSLNIKATGLAEMKPANGIFIMFSAGAKQLALDGLTTDDPNPNSVFTRTLVPLLQRNDLSLVTMAKQVQPRVKELADTVGHLQTPAYYDEIIGDFYLVEKGAPSGPSVPAQSLVPPVDPCTGAFEHWTSAQSVGTRAIFVEHRTRFQKCSFASAADARIAALDEEELRRDRLRRQDEDRRRGEEDRRREDERRRAEEDRRRDDERRRSEEDRRREDERRRQERAEEEERQRTRVTKRVEPEAYEAAAQPGNCRGSGTMWSVSGGRAYLQGSPNSPGRTFYLCQSGGSLRGPVGSMLFSGSRQGDRYVGTGYVQVGRCRPVSYSVSGVVSNGHRTVTLSGSRPNIDESTCAVRGRSQNSMVFNLIGR